MAKRRHYKGYIHADQIKRYCEFYIDQYDGAKDMFTRGKCVAYDQMLSDIESGRLERGE